MLTVCVLPPGWLLVGLVVYLSRRAEARRLAGEWPASSRK